MTQELIENNDENKSEAVQIAGNIPISMKLVQSIYNEVTGKTEKLSKILRDHHEICFEDINQLNIKINQLYEQYNVVAKNCSVTIYHIDDCKEQFSSFERFKIYDKSSTSPCENIRLTYDFLIKLPGAPKVQPYKIEIDIHSRTAIRKRALNEHGIPKGILRIFASRTANIEIEYVDYTVARTFLVAIEHWYASVRKNKSSAIIEIAQKFSAHAPFLLKNITAAIVIFSFFSQRKTILGANPSLETVFCASLIAFGSVYILSSIAKFFGQALETAIDSYQASSSLRLNRGDESAITEFERHNSKTIIAMAASIVGAITINIISGCIAKLIGVET